jgi:putative exporter of polyketide antibiotics
MHRRLHPAPTVKDRHDVTDAAMHILDLANAGNFNAAWREYNHLALSLERRDLVTWALSLVLLLNKYITTKARTDPAA